MKQNYALKLESSSPLQTINYGKLFSKVLKGGDVLVLGGSLGAGKTTFTKGILKGLGWRGTVLSPSFTLIRQYPFRKLMVYHADLYRLNKASADNLGIEEFIYSPDSMAIIEWGDKIVRELPTYLEVRFFYLENERRKLWITSEGLEKERVAKIKRFFGR